MRFMRVNRRIRRQLSLIALILLAILVALLWRHFMSSEPVNLTTATKQVKVIQTDEPIQPIPINIAVDSNKIALGEKLFQDVRLSSDNRISCVSCHNFSQGGADRRSHSIGIAGAKTEVNSPTIFNVRFNFRFNWDGEFEDLSAHLNALMTNPKVMGVQWETAIQALQNVPEYVQSFDRIYPDGINQTNIKDAIVAYELSLNTPNARFDRYLQGDERALTATEQEGYRLFKRLMCKDYFFLIDFSFLYSLPFSISIMRDSSLFMAFFFVMVFFVGQFAFQPLDNIRLDARGKWCRLLSTAQSPVRRQWISMLTQVFVTISSY
ncbi:MAG: cytochrome-c peroxidase [Hydrococcus sp. Prado102]|nr:cytochrome-c peroxidase [Hydrococcus sp. Prado102]